MHALHNAEADTSYLSRLEAGFALVQIALHLAHNLVVRQWQEGVCMVEICRNDSAWLCLVLILPHMTHGN